MNWNTTAATAAVSLLTLFLGGTPALAQQFIRNTADIPASSGFTENVDFGDIDNDGDWDAAFAEGGDFGNVQDRLWVNSGGIQGGTVGVFVDVTATQAPAILDDSRDIEFVDFDNDSDIDVYVSNTSTNSNQANHWWTNTGALQAGTMGFYTEGPSTRWSGLGGPGSSIPPSQVLGSGGFIDFSCDCDFGDLDNDGDLDLYHSTYGGNFGGQIPSRIFLNDGLGVFTEFNPSGFQLIGQLINNGNPGLWCEGTQAANTTNSNGTNCDVASTALGIELGDLDGDLDIDVLHGARVELPRMYYNRLEENGGTLGFRDVTGAVFPPGYSTGGAHYEQEIGDFDGDGDLDIYGLNWVGLTDITLRNNGAGIFRDLTSLTNSDSDDNEGDFIDYDLDGDVDLFIANFSGQDRMYRNNGAGVFTYMGAGVLPIDSTTSLDADSADVNNDGDPDIFTANDGNQPEWYLQNTTLADDTSAPVLYRLEQAPDRAADPTPTVVRVQVEDNQPYYGTWYIPVHLEVSVNGGTPVDYPMMSSQAQIFRGEIPGSLVGMVSYRAVATDQYGNTGMSNTLSYQATGINALTPFCDPGDGGIVPCPCGNPPSGSQRGCDNFAANSGGASISATGTASLTGDTLVLTAVGENGTAFTIIWSGKDPVSSTGIPHAAGVRCVTATLRRIYSGSASGGAISRPGGGDASVHDRHIAVGDPILSGEGRNYFTIYRDPSAAGPCGSTSSTINLSNAGRIVWGP